MKRKTLSVVLAVLNEETNLDKCLRSVRNIADEIVVVDEGSTDSTISIARKYNSKVILTTHHSNFHISKNIAIDSSAMEWTLQLDADEEVSEELSKEIIDVINSNPQENGFWINRKNWFIYRFLTKGGQYPDPTLRLYRTGKGRLPAKDVHEQAVVEGKTGHLKNPLYHYRDKSFEKYMGGFNRYSSFMAIQYKDRHMKINTLSIVNYLFLKPLLTFVKIYIRHRGYVDGMAGLIFATYSGLIIPVSFIKFWQITNND